jgi:hypothetical protein
MFEQLDNNVRNIDAATNARHRRKIVRLVDSFYPAEPANGEINPRQAYEQLERWIGLDLLLKAICRRSTTESHDMLYVTSGVFYPRIILEEFQEQYGNTAHQQRRNLDNDNDDDDGSDSFDDDPDDDPDEGKAVKSGKMVRQTSGKGKVATKPKRKQPSRRSTRDFGSYDDQSPEPRNENAKVARKRTNTNSETQPTKEDYQKMFEEKLLRDKEEELLKQKMFREYMAANHPDVEMDEDTKPAATDTSTIRRKQKAERKPSASSSQSNKSQPATRNIDGYTDFRKAVRNALQPGHPNTGIGSPIREDERPRKATAESKLKSPPSASRSKLKSPPSASREKSGTRVNLSANDVYPTSLTSSSSEEDEPVKKKQKKNKSPSKQKASSSASREKSGTKSSRDPSSANENEEPRKKHGASTTESKQKASSPVSRQKSETIPNLAANETLPLAFSSSESEDEAHPDTRAKKKEENTVSDHDQRHARTSEKARTTNSRNNKVQMVESVIDVDDIDNASDGGADVPKETERIVVKEERRPKFRNIDERKTAEPEEDTEELDEDFVDDAIDEDGGSDDDENGGTNQDDDVDEDDR